MKKILFNILIILGIVVSYPNKTQAQEKNDEYLLDMILSESESKDIQQNDLLDTEKQEKQDSVSLTEEEQKTTENSLKDKFF